jgi:hypothetical protein
VKPEQSTNFPLVGFLSLDIVSAVFEVTRLFTLV